MKHLLMLAAAAGLALPTSSANAEERTLSSYKPVLSATLERAWPIDPAKGVATREVAENVYVVTDGVWQSAFVVTADGVIVLDAPETYAQKIPGEIAAVTEQPITSLVYTHAHNDHIGGSAAFGQIAGLEIIALDGVSEFLAEKQDPNRLMPTRTFDESLVLERGGVRIELTEANYHSDEGDVIVYVPSAKFLMAVDTIAPGYVPFMGFDITSNFHEYSKVFETLLGYDFDVFVGGHLSHPGDRDDVLVGQEFVQDVYETVKRVHAETDMMGVFVEAAGEIGNFDNKYLLFKVFLDEVAAKAAAELEARWQERLAGTDVWMEDHVRTALVYVRWDD